MKIQIEINEKQLAEFLQLWFQGVDFSKPHFFKRNIVAETIKNELKMRGFWKNRVRGKKTAVK